MMIEWLGYALVVSVLVSVAAWLAEGGVRAQRWPSRWIWAAAMGGSVLGPLMVWLAPATETGGGAPLAAIPGSYVLESLPALSPAGAAVGGPAWDTLLLWGWAVSSALLLLLFAALVVRLRLRLRSWRSSVVDGVDVWISRRTGPAAIGLLRGRVVIPEWALDLEPEHRRLLVLHEAEHVGARDPQLALAGLLACVAAPWNLPLWWQLKRLRLAIEVDCDARVLGGSVDPRTYGSLLVTVGQRKSHLALALAESKSMLERRIRMIRKRGAGGAALRTLVLAGLSALIVVVACETPVPTGPAAVQQQPLELEATRQAIAAMECEPAVYINGDRGSLEDVAAENVESIHVFKKPATGEVVASGEGCGGVVVITKDASAEAADAARRLIERLVAQRMPAPGEYVASEVTSDGRSLADVQDAPTFTPMTVRPALTNQEEVRAALQSLYPAALKAAGIGGTVNVWFLIDREGAVHRTLIRRSSGHTALDEAALAVAERMEFTPAYNRQERVPVWVALDIGFETAGGDEAEGLVGGAAGDRARSQARGQAQSRAERERYEAVEVARERTEPVGVPAPSADAKSSGAPRFTPMTVRPRLTNPQEIQAALREHYPPLLREAGIGGTARIWFFIDETGRVAKVQIHESSGKAELDEAALAVARQMEFAPALNGDDPVAVWVSLAVTFAVR